MPLSWKYIFLNINVHTIEVIGKDKSYWLI